MSGMQIVRIWHRDDDGPIEQIAVRAGPTPVPGLVINEDPQLSGTWNITHAASGAAVACKFGSPEHALHIALKLAGVCDWTMGREEITVIEHITTPRTLLAKERGEIAAFLRDNRAGVDADRITELLDFCELHGDAVEIRAGVHLFLTAAGWGADVFAARTEAA